MEYFVDEMPKDCIDCPCESEYYCNLLNEDVGCCKWGEIHKNCPLQSLADYTKQVRKEVCNDFKSRFLATCQIEKWCDTASFSLEVLNKILDQHKENSMSENINMVDALHKTIYNQNQQIAELKKQLKEKNQHITELKKQLEETKQTGSYQVMLMCQKENILLKQQLKSQPAEIVEKIRQLLGLKLEYKHNENVPILKICNQINEVLDTILKEYQK